MNPVSGTESNSGQLRDVQAKIIARSKRVIAQILHDYIPEYEGIPVDEIIRNYLIQNPQVREQRVDPPLLPGGSNESKIPGEGAVYFDVVIDALAPADEDETGGRTTPDAKTGEMIRIIFNFEVQNNPHPGYPLPMRAEYYTARKLSQQYGETFTHADYQNLKKVYSVWIVPYAPQSWGNNVLLFPGEHAPKVLQGKNHYKRGEYGLWNYVFLEIGDPQKLTENKDAMGLLSVLFSLTMKSAEQTETLRKNFDLRLDHQEEVDLIAMQEMLSISEVYRERMQAEIDAAKERLNVQEKKAEEQLKAQKRQAEEQLKEQSIASYVEAGIQFGADPDTLRKAVKSKFGLSDADAAALMHEVQASRSQRPS